MKLEARKCSCGGTNIILTIGKRTYENCWSSPPKDIINFDMEYLINRYPVINTKKRAEEFSRLYKLLWVEVSEEQFEEMQHSLGLLYKKYPYRNRYFTSANDEKWNDLVNKGLAIKGSNHINNDDNVYFYLTKMGVEFVTGKKISDVDYQDL